MEEEKEKDPSLSSSLTTTTTTAAAAAAAHGDKKKAWKMLEGEKRAALKKAKNLKGKKGKEALAAIEVEYDDKFRALEAQFRLEMPQDEEEEEGVGQQQQQRQIAAQSVNDAKKESGGGGGGGESESGGDVVNPVLVAVAETATMTIDDGSNNNNNNNNSIATSSSNTSSGTMMMTDKERKLEKARRKKERQRQKELQEAKEMEEIAANAGPNLRIVEMEQLNTQYLTPLGYRVEEVKADGHCLYRAIGAQIQQDYRHIRSLCADALERYRDEFEPFCDYGSTDDVAAGHGGRHETATGSSSSSYEEYVDQVRHSADWGGHLELRAIGRALRRPIVIYSADRPPLTIQDDDGDGDVDGDGNVDANGVGVASSSSSSSRGNDKDPIRLSYHHHYYALGEHYNQVVPK